MTDNTAPTERADLPAFLASHLNGLTAEHVSSDFSELLAAVVDRGKKGSLTLTVTVEPPADGIDGGPVAIAIESALKTPKGQVQRSLYFLDAAGNPTREDPSQLAMEFRTAPARNEFKDA